MSGYLTINRSFKKSAAHPDCLKEDKYIHFNDEIDINEKSFIGFRIRINFYYIIHHDTRNIKKMLTQSFIVKYWNIL